MENTRPQREGRDEVRITTIWPTIGATRTGRWVGRLCAVRVGCGEFWTVGKLLALLTIPISLAVFCWQLLPFVCRRYALTSRRIIVCKGYSAVEERSVALDGFDAIEVEILPGQEWLRAGELVFRRGGIEVLRLRGVSRPEVFRQAVLKVRLALLSVRKVIGQQSA